MRDAVRAGARASTAASTSSSTTPASRPTTTPRCSTRRYEAWQRVQDVNLKSVFLCCKHGIPHLLENEAAARSSTPRRSSRSWAPRRRRSPTPRRKGGVLAMSRELGVEFARRGVRVNALCPGPVDTPLLRELFAKDPEKAARAARPRADGPLRARPRRSPPARCSSPATSRRSSPPRRSSSTAASAAPTSPPSKPSYEPLRFSLTAGQRGGASSLHAHPQDSARRWRRSDPRRRRGRRHRA